MVLLKTPPYFRLTWYLVKRHYKIHFMVKNLKVKLIVLLATTAPPWTWTNDSPSMAPTLLRLQSGLHLALFLPKGEDSNGSRGACAPCLSVPGTLEFFTCIALSPFSRPAWVFFPGCLLLRADRTAVICNSKPAVAKGELFSRKVNWSWTWTRNPHVWPEGLHILDRS